MIAALGGEPDHLDEAVTRQATSTSSDPQAREERAAEISALVAAYQ